MENKSSKPLEKLGGVLLIAESGSFDTTSVLLMFDAIKQTYEIPFTTKPKDQSLLRACITKVATLVDAQTTDINLDKTWKFEETKNDTSFTIFLGRAKSDAKVASKSSASQWILLSALHTVPLVPRDRAIHELLLNQLYKFLFPNVAVPKLAVVAPQPKQVQQSAVDTKRFVVHCKKSKYDVYIGRPNPTIPLSNKDCAWGNPFKIGDHGTREDVIRKYDAWIRGKPELIEKAKKELKGKVLACWCAPEACHGDVLARIANSEDANEVVSKVNVNDFVVHCKKSRYDIYIGRPNPAIKDSYNAKWGNPFKKSEIGEKTERLRLYEEWITSNPELIQQAKQELKGKVLGCWCVPEACHGHILARIANE